METRITISLARRRNIQTNSAHRKISLWQTPFFTRKGEDDLLCFTLNVRHKTKTYIPPQQVHFRNTKDCLKILWNPSTSFRTYHGARWSREACDKKTKLPPKNSPKTGALFPAIFTVQGGQREKNRGGMCKRSTLVDDKLQLIYLAELVNDDELGS